MLTTLVRDVWSTVASLATETDSTVAYVRGSEAALAAVGLLLVAVGALWVPRLLRRADARTRTAITIPALLSTPRPSRASRILRATRHAAFLCFVAGVPFFFVALSAPQTALVQQETTYPGHRIAILIDASLSMDSSFATERLRAGNTFLANVAAAEYFVRRRMDGPYHDLVSLIQFGSQAYIVTPFTNDYENVLLSIALIGTPEEYDRFPDHGTLVMEAINRGVQLFRTFDFLESAGNLIVIFSDGQDTHAVYQGLSLDDVLQQASDNEIPVYFIRTSYNRELGDLLPDVTWKAAVERTGGRFFPAANEGAILDAIEEIDRLSAGEIRVNRYITRHPSFDPFAFAAAGCWTLALALGLGGTHFRRFP